METFLNAINKEVRNHQLKKRESSLLITKLKVLTNTANPLLYRQNRMTAMLADMPQMDHDKVFLHLADVFSKLLKIKKSKQ